MNTNSMQPKVMFIYSLPQNKVAEMEQKLFNYSLFLSKIQGIEGVEVHELCEDFFSTTHKCQILIVLGEYLGDEQALLLHDDSLFPLDELINKISISCNGVEVIDMAFCYSGEWREKLKKLTNALVNGNNEKTQVEARLQLYPLLLLRKDLGRENYKESYDIILDKLEKKQNRRNPQELANLPESTKLGTMSTSAAPKTVYRNSPFHVKVYIHIDGNEADINAEINGYGYIPRKIRDLKLNNGDQILWELSFNTNPKPEYAKHILGADRKNIIWDSEKTKADYTFECFVEQEFEVNGFNGVLKTTVGKNEIDKWTFPVIVLPYKDLLGGNTPTEIKSEENSITKLNSTNIKEVEVDEKKVNAFKTAYNDTAKLLEHIDKQKEKIGKDEKIDELLIQDYDKVKKEIEKIKDTSDDKNLHSKQIRRIYILDKRLEMLLSIKKIQRLMKLVPISKENKKEIRSQARTFFSCLFNDKIDINVFDTLLKRIYTRVDGKDVKRFDSEGGSPTRAFNGLAIILADPKNGNKIHNFMYKKEKLPQVPSKKNQKEQKKNQDYDVVVKYVKPYLKGVLSDNSIKEAADVYLGTNDGHSSVFAYYLSRLFEEYRD